MTTEQVAFNREHARAVYAEMIAEYGLAQVERITDLDRADRNALAAAYLNTLSTLDRIDMLSGMNLTPVELALDDSMESDYLRRRICESVVQRCKNPINESLARACELARKPYHSESEQSLDLGAARRGE